MSKWLLGVVAVALLAGCARAPVPAPPEPDPPAVQAPAAEDPAPAAETECRPEPGEGKNRIDLVVDGKPIGSLPARDCIIKAVAGADLILRIFPSTGIGKPVNTPVGDGLWEYPDESLTIPAFGVEWNSRMSLKLDLAEQGLGEFTYTFVPRAATKYSLESAVDRGGPWTPVKGSLIPPQHGWLRFTYTAPMGQTDGPVLGSREPHDLPVQWEGDRTAYLNLVGAPVVFKVDGGRDRDGFPASGPVPTWEFLYRSEKPQLARVTAAGQATPFYTLKGVPERMHIGDGKFYYQLAQYGGFTVDLATGAESDGPYIQGGHGYGETWVQSPVVYLYADLALPGGPDLQADRIDPVDLIISDTSWNEVARVAAFIHAHRIVPGCSWWGERSLVWRPDGGAVAAISVPEKGKLQLVTYDLATKQRTVLAERQGDPSGAFGGLSWSPGGRYLTFGQYLLDSQTGTFMAEGVSVSSKVRWNPTGTHLLEKRANPFVRWEEMAIIEAASGKRTPLGYGDTLGWTADGEAFVVRWDEAAHIPPPAKGCLP